jgi:type 1 glutamine amidotransferase
LGPVTVQTRDGGRFEVIDEAYHDLCHADDCTVLATVTIDDGPQPVAWIRRHGAGRVAIDALGHDARSLDHPGHRALLNDMLAWVGR